MDRLRIEQVAYSYGEKAPTLININLEIKRGEFHCLVGRSGCGKTSLLNIASGLLIPDQGTVYINGQRLKKPIADAGFVFQSPTLLEWKTVLENILFPIELKRKSTQKEQERALSLLSLMKISDQAHQFPQQLSGGQQSRVAIARALIKNPPFLFMDEPFAALDAITREEIQDDLLAICNDQNMTALFITHDISEAVYLSSHVSVMGKGNIMYNKEINLPEPRTLKVRYSEHFNELSHLIRQALEGNNRK
ncbi:ABC transporter ATP-binding protein [Oceanisphaera arctica]|uniref:Nitrate ABC transporter ATP-binding protein n=1 Tax=Oceanisphaera arctica TaxID=641510 RepID=A0A2P5TPS2_9GAMM|nr:ABC transporter ATP-binding protein [Oceanisphaera arctica]PPL17714.1 nitrate ABC transporter ATP-binding protein [Oceanisphaera arctica]GHA18478.1 ABC transporter ATP-binding protein [Oceanisphaera arctica]